VPAPAPLRRTAAPLQRRSHADQRVRAPMPHRSATRVRRTPLPAAALRKRSVASRRCRPAERPARLQRTAPAPVGRRIRARSQEQPLNPSTAALQATSREPETLQQRRRAQAQPGLIPACGFESLLKLGLFSLETVIPGLGAGPSIALLAASSVSRYPALTRRDRTCNTGVVKRPRGLPPFLTSNDRPHRKS